MQWQGNLGRTKLTRQILCMYQAAQPILLSPPVFHCTHLVPGMSCTPCIQQRHQ
jgi:hypothetical protein